jgi:hypothetical protein
MRFFKTSPLPPSEGGGWMRRGIVGLGLMLAAVVGLGQVRFEKADVKVFRVVWDRVAEADVKEYRVYSGPHSRQYDKSEVTADTFMTILVARALLEDSIFMAVTALDSNGNESAFSEEVAGVPAVIDLDYANDSLRRIDVNDLRQFVREYRLKFGKTSYKVKAE